jgi:hypothetical protein
MGNRKTKYSYTVKYLIEFTFVVKKHCSEIQWWAFILLYNHDNMQKNCSLARSRKKDRLIWSQISRSLPAGPELNFGAAWTAFESPPGFRNQVYLAMAQANLAEFKIYGHNWDRKQFVLLKLILTDTDGRVVKIPVSCLGGPAYTCLDLQTGYVHGELSLLS